MANADVEAARKKRFSAVQATVNAFVHGGPDAKQAIPHLPNEVITSNSIS